MKPIIEFLLTGVSRIHAEERVEALLNMFVGLLPEMSEGDIMTAREQVIARFWSEPATADAVVDLIDGHVALRELLGAEDPLAGSDSRNAQSDS